MTTPAENWTRSATVPTTCYRLFPGMSSWEKEADTSVTVSISRLVRPASITIPRRADGTRGPGAFYRQGGIISLPQGKFYWSQDAANQYRQLYSPYGSINLLGGSIPIPTLDYDVEHRARYKLLKNVKNSKVNLGVALGEARETARLLSNSAERIARGVRAFRKGNPAKVWNAVKRGGREIPNSWLELQYGWNPLMQDVLGSAEALADAQNMGRRFNLCIKGSASDVSPFELVREHPGGLSVLYTGETKQHCKIVCNYDLPASLLPALSSLGLTNPAEVVWELVPYSFVIDWFYPLGDWLGTLDAGHFLQFREGCVSRIGRHTAYGFNYVAGGFNYQYNKQAVTDRPGILRTYNFSRVLLYNTPGVDLPRLRSPLALGKVANALSLLSSAFSRRKA